MESEPIPEKMITKTDLEAAHEAAEQLQSDLSAVLRVNIALQQELAKAKADLAASQKRETAMKEACQAALDWATERGRYANEKDTVAALAEKVARMLERAISPDAGKDGGQ